MIKKIIFVFLGSLTLLLGIVGIFLPILPTTPFLLLTAFFYLRSSERLYSWLLNHKKYGPYIEGILVDKAMTKKSKLRTVFTIWLTLSISIFLVPLLPVKILLAVIGASVSYYVIKLNTLDLS
jgi:uncharacterized membrane protein YbaN (DUF454 family)